MKKHYYHFFYPEIKRYLPNDELENELNLKDPNAFIKYEENRKKG